MKRIRCIVFLLACCLSFSNLESYAASKRTTLINVALVDADGEYISGANVTIAGEVVVPEIQQGFYSLWSMPYGEYELVIEKEGYLTKEWKFDFSVENYTLDFWLIPLEKAVPPNDITFSKQEIMLVEGEKTFLSLSYEPADVNLKEVKFLSSDPNIVTVTPNGRVSAQKPGRASVIAVSESKSPVFTVCHVSVTEKIDIQDKLNPESVFIETGYTPLDNKFVDMGYTLNFAKVAPTALKVGDNGNITVCAEPLDGNLPIGFFELDTTMAVIKRVDIEREMPLFGNFIRDGDGNFYVFFARAVQENETDARNMVLVKYDKDGKKLSNITFNALEDDSIRGVRVPFDAGSCRMEIAGDTLLVYFSREMFKTEDGKNHQASYGFMIDLRNFSRISSKNGCYTPFVSHSFDQFILADGDDFVFVDHGDAGNKRGFAFEKLIRKGNVVKSATGFKFKGKSDDNPVFSKLGALALAPSGYVFAAAAEKNNVLDNMWHNDSHNLFVQRINSDLSEFGEPVWLTQYTDKDTENAVFPKMAEISGGRYAVLWEKRGSAVNDPNTYKGTYMCIIDANGNKVMENTLIPAAVPLSRDDVLRYNSKTGRLCWATATEKGIVVHSLDPLQALSNNVKDMLTVTVTTADGKILPESEITVSGGIKFIPDEAGKYRAELPFGLHEARIEKKGYMPKTQGLSFYYKGQEANVILYGASINIYLEDDRGEPILTPAKITIDDGTTIPRVMEDAAFYSLLTKPFGRYTVTIEIEGYKPIKWTADFTEKSYTDKYWVIIMEK